MNFDLRAFLRHPHASPAVASSPAAHTSRSPSFPSDGSPTDRDSGTSADAPSDIARFEVGTQQLGAVKRPNGKLQTARAYRLFWALRERGLDLNVEVKTDLLVGPAGDLTSAEREDIEGCCHELAAMAPVMMSRAEADAFTQRMMAFAAANDDWGFAVLNTWSSAAAINASRQPRPLIARSNTQTTIGASIDAPPKSRSGVLRLAQTPVREDLPVVRTDNERSAYMLCGVFSDGGLGRMVRAGIYAAPCADASTREIADA